ncbi:hypothetical protein [Skermania piniformis]|uniref:Uncharacterized protein n=1 Tax=Skermania pinensis TaxID=39122 RepID=A0ABX8S9C2_9ACTN|nr:hypothetical protein [Skermania piniformis]QXQ13160.1 hypothetical protein KV203_14905 [Skermania piniformis]
MHASNSAARTSSVARTRLLAALLGVGVGVLTGQGIAAAGPGGRPVPTTDPATTTDRATTDPGPAAPAPAKSNPRSIGRTGAAGVGARSNAGPRDTTPSQTTGPDTPRTGSGTANPRRSTRPAPTSDEPEPEPARSPTTTQPKHAAAAPPRPEPPTPKQPGPEPTAPTRVHTTDVLDLDAVTGSVDLDAVTGSADLDAVTRSADLDAVTRSADLDAVTRSADLDAVTRSADLDAVTRSMETIADTAPPDDGKPPASPAANPWLLLWGVRRENDPGFPWLVEPTTPSADHTESTEPADTTEPADATGPASVARPAGVAEPAPKPERAARPSPHRSSNPSHVLTATPTRIDERTGAIGYHIAPADPDRAPATLIVAGTGRGTVTVDTAGDAVYTPDLPARYAAGDAAATAADLFDTFTATGTDRTGAPVGTVVTVPIAAANSIPIAGVSGDDATTVYYAPDGGRAYLVQPRGDGVHLLAVETATGRTDPVVVIPGTPPSTTPTGESAPDLWFSPDGAYAYLITSRQVEPNPAPPAAARYSAYLTDLTIVDTRTGTVTTTELGPGTTYQVIPAPEIGRLYVLGYTVSATDRRIDRVTVVDLAAGRAVDVIGLTDPASTGRGRPTGTRTPDGRYLYVAGDTGDSIDLTILDTRKPGIVRTTLPGRSFSFLSTRSGDAAGYLVSTAPESSTTNGYRTYLTAVDPADGTARQVVTAPGTAVDLAFTPDGDHGYLITKTSDDRSLDATTHLTRIDLARTDDVPTSTTTTVPGTPEPLLAAHDIARIYLTTHSYNRTTRESTTLLTAVDTTTGDTTTQVGPGTSAPVLTSDQTQMYVTASVTESGTPTSTTPTSTTLTRVDTRTGASSTLSRPGTRKALSIGPDGAHVVLTTITGADSPNASSTVTVVATADGAPVATVTVPGDAQQVAVDPAGRYVYLATEVTDPTGNRSTVLTRVATATGASSTVDVQAGQTMRVDFAPDTSSAYLTTWVIGTGPVITLVRLG